MGLFVDELCSSVIVTHVLYKTAVVIAVMRWVLSWAIRLRNRASNNDTNTTNHFQSEEEEEEEEDLPCPSTQFIRDSLILTTFGEFRERLPNCPWDTCAVCLNQFGTRDEVRELRNCCHVFHRECLDKWLDHDRQSHSHSHNHDSVHQSKTCPLCRSPLLTDSQTQSLSLDSPRSQPSWAVERLLYLFGDDLLL